MVSWAGPIAMSVVACIVRPMGNVTKNAHKLGYEDVGAIVTLGELGKHAIRGRLAAFTFRELNNNVVLHVVLPEGVEPEVVKIETSLATQVDLEGQQYK